MSDFLLEILVQELPYKFIPDAQKQLKDAFEKLFSQYGIEYKTLDVQATPRRLAVMVFDLTDKQKDIVKEARGPILNIALDENKNFTPAALGFAKKNNAQESDLYIKDNYIWAKVEIKGKSTKEILSENIEDIIFKMQGAHFMRWGSHEQKFSRPIENIVALYNNDILPLKVLDKTSANTTLGHRFSANKVVKITNAKTYVDDLRKANVIVNVEERKKVIVESAKKCADTINTVINFDNLDDLLEEVTYITEYPIPVLCDFDKKYLEIPDIVTTTVMSKHQRYFPLWQKDGKLSNHFITMANFVGTDKESMDNIKAGNQRVVSARLEDGIFFYKEDTKTPLVDKVDTPEQPYGRPRLLGRHAALCSADVLPRLCYGQPPAALLCTLPGVVRFLLCRYGGTRTKHHSASRQRDACRSFIVNPLPLFGRVAAVRGPVTVDGSLANQIQLHALCRCCHSSGTEKPRPATTGRPPFAHR